MAVCSSATVRRRAQDSSGRSIENAAFRILRRTGPGAWFARTGRAARRIRTICPYRRIVLSQSIRAASPSFDVNEQSTNIRASQQEVCCNMKSSLCPA